MDLKEISALIEIKRYMNETVNNFTISKSALVDLRKMIVALDKVIIEKLLSSEFKEFVNFSNADQAMKEAAKNNDIKSGITWDGSGWVAKK